MNWKKRTSLYDQIAFQNQLGDSPKPESISSNDKGEDFRETLKHRLLESLANEEESSSESRSRLSSKSSLSSVPSIGSNDSERRWAAIESRHRRRENQERKKVAAYKQMQKEQKQAKAAIKANVLAAKKGGIGNSKIAIARARRGSFMVTAGGLSNNLSMGLNANDKKSSMIAGRKSVGLGECGGMIYTGIRRSTLLRGQIISES